MEFDILGKTIHHPLKKLETFRKPANVHTVIMKSDEVTSMCPVTGQPDWETVTIEYAPDQLCVESKSLKLYFWSFRDEGCFCEALADQIANDFFSACEPFWCKVTVVQKPRGGIEITSIAEIKRDIEA
ncbi:MAG TPA: preQ(1) synthase [Anaerolineae bacterium]|jgi:7-cyano-7-deazaguanine reductase|nr:preQ(1) synthase [Anaerolineae bacterium]